MSIDMVRDPNISASALLAFMSALIILLIGMLGDALATRLGRLNSQVLGVRTSGFCGRRSPHRGRELRSRRRAQAYSDRLKLPGTWQKS